MNAKLVVIAFNLLQRNRKLQQALRVSLEELNQIESLLKLLLEGLNIEAVKNEQRRALERMEV